MYRCFQCPINDIIVSFIFSLPSVNGDISNILTRFDIKKQFRVKKQVVELSHSFLTSIAVLCTLYKVHNFHESICSRNVAFFKSMISSSLTFQQFNLKSFFCGREKRETFVAVILRTSTFFRKGFC